MLVYNSTLENQHKATQKFARRWFEPYMVTRVNDNAMYHISTFDRTRIAVPVTVSQSFLCVWLRTGPAGALDREDIRDEEMGD